MYFELPENLECMATMENITVENDNYCFYKTMPSGTWHPSKFCIYIVEELLNTQFDKYIHNINSSDCLAELKRLLDKGPPIYISDDNALPIPNSDLYISDLWFSNTKTIKSAILKNAKLDKERQILWEKLKKKINSKFNCDI